MGILIFLIPLALLLSLAAVGAYIWAVRHRQFDDLDTPPITLLIEDHKDGP